MKKSATLTSIFASIALTAMSISMPFSAHAGVESSDEIVVFRTVESSSTVHYWESGSLKRFREKSTEYHIVNLTTGQYRTVYYETATERDENERRIRVKRYYADNNDLDLQVLFQASETVRKQLMILSLEGTGMGNNFEYYDSGSGFVDTEALTETLVGTVKTQRIRTEAGVIECLAPSTIKGPQSYERNESALGDNYRKVREGKRTMRLDKSRIRDGKDAGATTLEDFQNAVVDYLVSKGYEMEPG